MKFNIGAQTKMTGIVINFENCARTIARCCTLAHLRAQVQLKGSTGKNFPMTVADTTTFLVVFHQGLGQKFRSYTQCNNLEF